MPRDRSALPKLVGYANGDVNEAVLRFRRMLREKTVLMNAGTTIWQLAEKWNALTRKAAPTNQWTATVDGCRRCGEKPCMCPKQKPEEAAPAQRSKWGAR